VYIRYDEEISLTITIEIMAPLLAAWLGKPQPDGALFSTEQAVHPRLLQGYS
jgi:hypothetical protein